MIEAVTRAWMPSWPAARLGALRIALGGFALAWMGIRLPAFANAGRFAPDAFEAVGAAAALDAALSPAVWHGVLAATAVTGAAFCVGWRFAVSGPAFALLLLFVTSYRSSFGMVFHTENHPRKMESSGGRLWTLPCFDCGHEPRLPVNDSAKVPPIVAHSSVLCLHPTGGR